MTVLTKLTKIVGLGFSLTPMVTLAQEIDPTTKFFQDMSIMGLWVALPIIIITIMAIAASLEDRRRFRLIETLIKDGRDIPPELFLSSKERKDQRSQRSPADQRQHDLRSCIFLLSLGLATALVLYLMSGELRIAAWSLIFFFLGGASFVNAQLTKTATANDTGAASQK